MIYLIFTEQGFEEAKADILKSKATLWINPNTLTDLQTDELQQNQIDCTILPNYTKVNDERGVINALQYVEKQSQDKNILVEFL